jgi:hypothetical protein
VDFLGGFFWVGFLGGFFNANPGKNKYFTSPPLLHDHLSIQDETTFNTVGRMKAELTALRGQLSAQERAVADLGHDMKIMESLAAEAQSSLGTLQNELTIVTEELAKIYHHICTANNITPSRIMLEHSKGELHPQSKELTRGPPELVKHFRL